MRKSFLVILFLTAASAGVFAQSGRVIPAGSETPSAPLSPNSADAEKMYGEANEYAKVKYAEFEQKKIPYSENLRVQTVREQKQLAAKYAAMLTARQDLATEDFYYLGMLHWIAENTDGADEILRKYLALENPVMEKAQTARSVLMVVAARRRNFDEAEKILAEYLNHPDSVKPRDRGKMENELAVAYFSTKDYARAAAHGEESYRITKETFQDLASRARGLAELLDNGRTLFEIYKAQGDLKKGDAVLEDLRKSGAAAQSTGVYYFAIDNLVKYMIETSRKPQAIAYYEKTLDQIEKDFKAKPLQEDAATRLKKRGKHYRLMGDTAPELVEVSAWLPDRAAPIASLHGKVVLIDFWATWCGPCIDTFPELIEMYKNYRKDGLEILGVTRYYGQAEGEDVDPKTELEAIGRFREKYELPYKLVVAQSNTNQVIYGASGLPTAVIIDRKGIIRYIETGTNPTRKQEIEEVIKKLLAEE